MKGINLDFLSAEDIQAVISIDDVLKTTENTYRLLTGDRITCPTKTSMPLPGNNEKDMNWINSMPALLKDENIAGLKWVNVTSRNRQRQLPVTVGTIILNDAETALPVAIMDGTWITHIRTGASVAIGAKYLARKNSKVLCIIGAGSEGRSAFDSLTRVFDLEKVNIVDINTVASNNFVAEKSVNNNIKFSVFTDAQKAVKDADMIILTTTSRTPIVKFEWAKPGDFICTISCFTDLDSRFVKGSNKLVVDTHCSISRISAMSGLQVSNEDIYAEIGQIVTGEKIGRDNDKEIIIYAPAGTGAVDVAIAALAWQRAKKQNLSKPLSLVGDLANLAR